MKLQTNTKQWSWLFLAVIALMLAPDAAMAVDTPIGDTLCEVVAWFTGNIGKGIATLAIIIIGVGALMGKVSWGMAIIVGVGVAIIFGAPDLVAALGADGAEGCDGA